MVKRAKIHSTSRGWEKSLKKSAKVGQKFIAQVVVGKNLLKNLQRLKSASTKSEELFGC